MDEQPMIMHPPAPLYPFAPLYQYASNFWPGKMLQTGSRALLIAIALQESRMKHRRQLGGGPARGLWQFELGETPQAGVRGILNHAATGKIIRDLLTALNYDHSPETSYHVIEHNDLLAITYARLLIWTVAGALPTRGQHQYAWDYYISGWHPGKPHRDTWSAFYDEAWEMVLS
jgi:hypothetical protein